MSLYLLEGFEYDNWTGLNKVWGIENTASISLEEGYKFGRCIRMRTGSTSNYKFLGLRATGTLPFSGVVGFWYRTNSYLQGSALTPSIVCFSNTLDNTTSTYSCAICGACNTPITIESQWVANATIKTTQYYLSPNVWYHFEFQYQILDNTNIPLILRINGKEVGRINPSCDAQEYGPGGMYLILGRYQSTDFTNEYAMYDHVYLYDFNGTETGFRGPCLVSGMYPISNGDVNQWNKVPSTGNAWDVVDDFYEQSNYVATSTSGAQQFYNLKDLTDNVNIQGIQHHILANRQTGPSNVKLKTLYRYDSNNYVTSTGDLKYSLGEFHIMNKSVERNPISDTIWTTGDIGNGQFGFELWNTGV
jgi:hypothetical protein